VPNVRPALAQLTGYAVRGPLARVRTGLSAEEAIYEVRVENSEARGASDRSYGIETGLVKT
jgi:hypothetical protein